MSSKDVFFMALKNISRTKTKFFLTSLSILIGICSVMIITTISDIGTNIISQKLNSMGIDGIFVKDNSKDGVLTDELIDKLKNNYEIDAIMPIISDFSKYTSTRASGQAVIWGVDQSLYETLRVNSLVGRCFSENEVNFAQKVAIIDENLANTLYGRVNILGKTISLNIDGVFTEFEIIGVISDQKELVDSFMGENSVSFIYIPYTVLQNLSGNDSFSQIAIRSSSDLEKLKSDLEFYFSKNKLLENTLEVQNISTYIDLISEIMKYITIILTFVAGISMIVAGIGVLNIMLSSTIERKKEIGIYMALGAKKSEVGWIFLTESIIICLFSGILGAIIGLSIVFLGANILNLPFYVNLKSILIIEAISLFCGVFAGIIPAKKASSLNPIDILRG